MKMKAIIPTGGKGTRMQPLTFSNNKHFIPVANKLLIEYPIETVVEAGIKDILITYNLGQLEAVKKILGDGSKYNAKFTYVLQKEPLGLANIFQVCEDYLEGRPFLLHLGDNIFTEGIKEYVEYFNKVRPNGMVTMVEHPENWRLGVPYFDENNRLIKYVEKPQNPPHKFAIPGLYFFDSTVFGCFTGKDAIKPSERGELEISSPYQWLIDKGYRVEVVEYKGKWLDPGKFDDWVESNKYILEHKANLKMQSVVDEKTILEGEVGIGKDCKIRNSKIVGPVIIGDNVEVDGSYIGPYTSVYHNCKVINSNVECSILLESVKVMGVKKTLRDTMIGRNSVVREGNSKNVNMFVGDKCEIVL